MGRAYCNMGLVHLALGNHDTALECQKYFLALAHMMKHLQDNFRALGNIGDVLMKMNNLSEAVKVYQKQLVLAKQLRDKVLEASAYGAPGKSKIFQFSNLSSIVSQTIRIVCHGVHQTSLPQAWRSDC